MIPDTRPHGPTWEKNEPGTRTKCGCGRVFDTDDGFYIHMGKMNKMSALINQDLQRKIDGVKIVKREIRE